MPGTNYPRLTPQELSATGQALFGAEWRAMLGRALGVTESEVVAVESGRVASPPEWRGKLIALAQDMALRSLEAANQLLWRDARESPQPLYAPQPPRLA